MRFVALVAAVCAISAGTASAAGQVTVTWPADGSPLRLLFVGDSLTDGALATNWKNQLRYQVLDSLEAHGQVTMTTRGKGGVPVRYWAARPMPAKQDVVIVELGTNDDRNVPTPNADNVKTFTAQYRQLVAAIRKTSPAAKIVCLSVWQPVGAPGSAPVYNQAIRSACPGAYVNITDIGTKAHLGSDGFHPNDAAHVLIGARILHAIHVA